MKCKKIKGMLVMVICIVMAFSFFGCSANESEIMFRVHDDYIQWKYSDGDSWNNLFSVSELNESGALNGKSAYDIAVAQGFEGSEEEWLASLVGDNGQSVRIGANGNWYIGTTDTGISAMGSANGNIYMMPDFTRRTLSEVQEMPEYKNFLVVCYGEVKDNFVMSQSIPSGVMVGQGTKVELYMNGYDWDSGTTDLPDGNEPSVPDENNYELTITRLTNKRAPKQVADIEVYGKPNTEYTIEVTYSSGVSTSQDLSPKMSDETGKVVWEWMISGSVLPGIYPIKVSDGVKSVTAYITVSYE